MTKAFVNSDNTANRPGGHYGKVISQIAMDGVCPFCPEHLMAYHPNPILADTTFWQLTNNAYPYKGAQHHFLIIHKEHIEDFEGITTEAWQDLRRLVKDTLAKYNIKGGAFICRFGETKFTGASVSHLHAQLVVGPGIKDADPVLMRVG